ASHFLDALDYALSEGIDPQEVRQRLSRAKFSDVYGKLFEELWKHYDDHKRKSGTIDFDDMILGATQRIKNGEIQTHWDYILVDEFQDISRPRFELVEQLKRQTPGAIVYMVG